MLLLKRSLTPLSRLRFLSSSSSSETLTNQTPPSPSPSPSPPHFMADYLITACGFSPDKATKLSKTFTHLKSPDRPDAVLRFLKHHGFNPPDIRRLVSLVPRLLAKSVDKTLAPNMSAILSPPGFISPPGGIPRFVIGNPAALSHNTHTASRIRFWTDFFSGDLDALRSAFNRNRNLIGHDVESSMALKIKLLKDFGLSHSQIQKLVLLGSIITRSPDSIRILLDRTLEAGFPKESPMFVYGLFAFASNGTAAIKAKMEFMKRCGWSESEFLSTFLKFPLFTRMSIQNIKAKMEFMKSFGWSEKDFFSALLKTPLFTCLSQENIQAKMDFLLGQAGCTPSYVALNPLILLFSLEKRLIPRHHILEILKAKGAHLTKPEGLRYIMAQTDSVFVKRFVLRYEEKVPGLQEAYNAACTGNMTQPKRTQ